MLIARLALIALVVVTSLALGIARGQVRAGSEVVLCGGMAVVVDPGDPGGGVHYCPDMAGALLLALDTAPPVVAPENAAARRAEPIAADCLAAMSGRAPQARGPPSRAARDPRPFQTLQARFPT